MSKVQVVIEIDERDYGVIKITPRIGVGKDCILDNTYEAIRDGIVLPEKHGRIADIDDIHFIYAEEDNITGSGMNYDEICGYNEAIDYIKHKLKHHTPIILEAKDGETDAT